MISIESKVIDGGFVPKEKQELLEKLGWSKDYDSFEKVEVNNLYPTGRRGMQTWKKHDLYDINTIYIHYDADGKHYCNLYSGESDNPDVFSLRFLRHALKKYMGESI